MPGFNDKVSGGDLRGWIDQVNRLGELVSIDGVDWNLEMGVLGEEFSLRSGGSKPTLLFDKIPGFPKGYRVNINQLNTVSRIALTLGLPVDLDERRFVQNWSDFFRNIRSVPVNEVENGPILENVYEGDQIDLLKFPAPHWHEHDGGRYIGTAGLTLMKDQNEGREWINCGVYRSMILSKDTLSLYVIPGKNASIIISKYLKAGKNVPVVMTFGQDPLLFLVSILDLPYGQPELEFAGGVRGTGIEVLKGKYTNLPIPSKAEIAIEGELILTEKAPEGPFGEWTGYYASGQRPEPIVKVKRLLHRNDPILCGSPTFRPPTGTNLMQGLTRSAVVWEGLEKAGVPGVTSVRCHAMAGHRFLIILSITQLYPGHARQAALVASQVPGAGLMSKYIIVVDEDIDIYNTDEVLWALCTRSDPEVSIDILRRCWGSPMDPMSAAQSANFTSRAIIDACIPFERRDTFPKIVRTSSETYRSIVEKYERELGRSGIS